MKVCILATNFPTFSETFVTDHIKALYDCELDLTVIADGQDPDAWRSLGEFGQLVKPRVHHFNRPKSNQPGYRWQRLRRLALMVRKHLRNREFSFLKAMNIFQFGSTVADLKLPFVLDQALEIGPVDVLHCHFGSNGILGAQLKRLGFCKKLVVTFHGLDVSKTILKKNNGKVYRDLYSQADAILPISALWRNALVASGAPEDKTQVHHLGVYPSDPARPASTANRNCFQIVTIARFTEKKGLPYALNAVKRLIEAQPSLDVRYHLIGSGVLWSKIQNLISDLDLGNNVILHGALPHEKTRSLLSQSDVFLLPSHTASNGDQEGIPVSLMEAMASGVPVISTVHSGIPELVESGRSGLLVAEKDAQTLSEALIELAADPGLRERLACEARRTIQENFNASTQNAGLVNLYQKLLS